MHRSPIDNRHHNAYRKTCLERKQHTIVERTQSIVQHSIHQCHLKNVGLYIQPAHVWKISNRQHSTISTMINKKSIIRYAHETNARRRQNFENDFVLSIQTSNLRKLPSITGQNIVSAHSYTSPLPLHTIQ